MIYSKLLHETNIVNHGFFNKTNGFSKGIYKSLNCGSGSKDKKSFVKKNLNYVQSKIRSKKNKIILLYQVHSAKFIHIKKIPQKKIIGDALITKNRNLPIGILTADCAPILLLDRNKKIIAAVHSGWKGALNGIIQNTDKYKIPEDFKYEKARELFKQEVIIPDISFKIEKMEEENLKKFLLEEKNMSEKFVNRYIQNFNKVTRKFRVNTVKNYFK